MKASNNDSVRLQRSRRPSNLPAAAPPRRFRGQFLLSCCTAESSLNAVSNESHAPPDYIAILEEAIIADRKEAVLQACSHVEPDVLYSLREKVFHNQPAIYYCILNGKLEAFKAILEFLNFPVFGSERDSLLRALLVHAVKCNKLAFVMYLIEQLGVVITADLKLFHYAIKFTAHNRLLEYLFAKIPHSFLVFPFNEKTGDNVWHTSVRFSNFSAFFFLYQKQFRMYLLAAINAHELTPIVMLLQMKQCKLLKQAIKHIPNFITGRFDHNANTLVHLAASYNFVPALKILLEREPLFIEAANVVRQTPLSFAVVSESVEAGRFLLQKGADPFAIEGAGLNI